MGQLVFWLRWLAKGAALGSTIARIDCLGEGAAISSPICRLVSN